MTNPYESPEEDIGARRSSAWRWAHIGYRQARRIVIAIVGFTILAVGVALIFLPGPALVVIPLGLAILAIEFAWARRWLGQARKASDGIRNHVLRRE